MGDHLSTSESLPETPVLVEAAIVVLLAAAEHLVPDVPVDLGAIAPPRAVAYALTNDDEALAPIGGAGWDGPCPEAPAAGLPVPIGTLIERGAIAVEAGHPGHVAWTVWLQACQARSMVVFPLLAGDGPVGVGVLASSAPLAFSDRHERLCQAQGRLIGLALAASRAQAQDRRQAERLTAVFDRLPEGLVLLGPGGVVDRMNAPALRVFGLGELPADVRFASLERGVQLQRLDGRPLAAFKLPSARLTRGETFHQVEAMITPFERTGRAYSVSGFELAGPEDGAVCFYQDRGRLWQREVELSTLYALTNATLASTCLESLLDRALGHILGLTHLRTGLLLYHTPTQPQPVYSQRGLPDELVAAALAFEAGCGMERLYRCLADAEPDGAPPPAEGPDAALQTRFCDAICSWVVLPLRHDDHLAGILLLGAADYNQLSDDLSQLLAAITSQLILAIERSQVQANLEDLIASRTTELVESHRRLEATVAELRRMDQFKSNFLSNVSHELRTPLSGIIGYGEFLAEGVYGDLTPEQQPILNQLVHSGYKLMELINNLLDLSRIDAGKLKLYMEPIELNTLFDQSLGQVLPQAMQRDIRLELPAERAPTVEVDPGRIVQVLVNLLSNAIKFTPEGGTIRVTAVPVGNEVTVAVSDTGIGIPAEHLPLLFMRFSQVDGSATRVYGGTGLGLAICRELIELHQQRIWVESHPGKGSTFYFTLPIWQPEPAEIITKG